MNNCNHRNVFHQHMIGDENDPTSYADVCSDCGEVIPSLEEEIKERENREFYRNSFPEYYKPHPFTASVFLGRKELAQTYTIGSDTVEDCLRLLGNKFNSHFFFQPTTGLIFEKNNQVVPVGVVYRQGYL